MTDIRYITSHDVYSREHLIAMGARMRALANDLKRDVNILAGELNTDIATVRKVLAGDASTEDALSLLKSMLHTYPVSMRELWVDVADTHNGVVVMSADASRGSARIYDRIDGTGRSRPYFEYRDTAMSRTGPYKPEYVRPLRQVDDTDPGNTALAYNKGHLLHQLTFYVGDVNVYWQQDGQRQGRQMRTGDSTYMTPFVPHTFACRGRGAHAHILAVTYSGEIEPAIATLGRHSSVDLARLAGDARDESQLFAALMARVLAARSIDSEELADALSVRGIARARAAELANGQSPAPTDDERRGLGVCLGLDPSFFCIQRLTADQAVVIKNTTDDLGRAFPYRGSAAYEITDLASTPHQPSLFGLNVRVLSHTGVKGADSGLIPPPIPG